MYFWELAARICKGKLGKDPINWRPSLSSRNLLHACALLSLSLAPATAVGQDVTIISPSSNRPVSSPVRVVAEFPRGAGVNYTISVDNVEVKAGSVTPLDLNVSMSEGDHLLTVTSLQSDGAMVSSSRWVKVLASPAAVGPSSSSSALLYSNIEEMSGWYNYPDLGDPLCSAKPSLTSKPSLDGVSGKFYIGPTGQFNTCLWPIRLGSSTTVTHFQLDAHYQISNPAYSQGIEFSSNHQVGTEWYKFSVQCSYDKGIFRVWNTAVGSWSPTNIPCHRPALNSWDHLTINTAISGGKAVFLSLALNGVQYPINKSSSPIPKSTSYDFGIHFQMNGDLAGHAYYAWVDELTFTAW
jgi:hypothetical protein